MAPVGAMRAPDLASTYEEFAAEHRNNAAAPFAPRFWARAVDAFAIFVASVVGTGIAFTFAGLPPKGDHRALFQCVGWSSTIVAAAVSEAIAGITPGKEVLGLRVIRNDFDPPRFTQAFQRQLALFVDTMLFGLVAYLTMRGNPYEQRLGDRWARTYVVRKAALPLDYQRPVSVGFAFGAYVATAVATTAVGNALVVMALG
mgnify:FL=1